jgi:hypothetical protein
MLSAALLVDILQSSMVSMFSGIDTRVGAPERSSSSVLKCPVLNVTTHFCAVELEGCLSSNVTDIYRVITKEMTEIKHVLLSHGVT